MPAVTPKAVKGHINAVQELVQNGQKAREWYRKRTQWSVTVSSTDRLYDVAHGWFTDTTTAQSVPPRALEARYDRKPRTHDDMIQPVDGTPHPIAFYYDEQQERTVNISGHQIRVSLHKPGDEGNVKSAVSESMNVFKPDILTFYAKSKEGQEVVVNLLRRLAASTEDQKPCLRMLNSWGSWSRRDDLPERKLSTVVLRDGQSERIRADLQSFLDSEADYVERGIPWHRGYLLHGEPGTGKTSIVKALAADLGLDLWYAPLGDLSKDTSLLNLISEVKPRSILLLEDIDVFHAAREREDASGKASMAALLNALDGVATPHGMITFLTTNEVSVIDKALIRPGRIDLIEEITYPDEDQVRRLYETFYGVPLTCSLPKVLVSTAAYMEIFKQNMNDPDQAAQALSHK
jgi:chaperone BCS1